MISGRSGLPKFRQLVSASGRAPVHATLRAASATAATVPAYGSSQHQRGLQSTESASALRVGGAVLALDAHQRGVAARPDHGVALHELVVLAVEPAPSSRGSASRAARAAPRSSRPRARPRRDRASGARAGRRARAAGRSSSGESSRHRVDRDVDHRLAVPAHAHAAVAGARARPPPRRGPSARRSPAPRPRGPPAPRAACAPGSRRAAARRASCRASRCGTRSRSSSMPVPAWLAISKDEQVRPAAPMSWMPTMASPRHHLEAGLDQTLLGEGIADLHGRALGVALCVELGRREQAGAVDAVAAGLAADVDHRVADAGGAARGRCGPPRRRRG